MVDQTLSYKKHIESIAVKINTRTHINFVELNRVPLPLAQALGLVYSTAKYLGPVWMNSGHTNKMDARLNNTMQIISG